MTASTPTSVRPLRTTCAALAAVAVLTTAAPAVLPGHATNLPAITRAYDLTAASDISGQAIGVVFLAGWGDFIGPDDPYFPGQFTNDLRLSGPLGVAYYMIDTSMNSAVTKDLENYIFELAALESDPVQAVQAAVRAAAYVAVASNLGVGSVPAKLVKSLVYGVPFDLPGAIVQLTAPIPLAGDIISVYFTGRAEGDPAVYGTGVNGLIAYSGTLLPWLKPLLGPAGEPQQAAASEQVRLADPAAADVVDAVPQDPPAADVRADGPADIAPDIAGDGAADGAAHAAVETPEPAGPQPGSSDPHNGVPNTGEAQTPAAPAVVPAEIETPTLVDSGDLVPAEADSPAEETSEPALAEIPASLPELETAAEPAEPAEPADQAEPADPAEPAQPGAPEPGADDSSDKGDRPSRRGNAGG